jgi:hypothetical protein
MSDTLLAISGPGVGPYSARGLTQTLDPIPQALQQRRNVNGALRDLSIPEFRKYKSTVSCNDTLPPAFDGWMPGLPVTVDCVAELSYKTIGGTPSRAVVPGSEFVEGEYTYYRPRLNMMTGELTMQRDEYQRVVAWTATFEEI